MKITDFILLPTGKAAQRGQLVRNTSGEPEYTRLRQPDCHDNKVYPDKEVFHLHQLNNGEIIASTDPTLGVPGIPNETIREFIRMFNNAE